MADIGELVIKARVDDTQARASLSGLQKGLLGLTTATGVAATGFAAVLNGINDTAVELDNLVNTASKLQIPVKDYQALVYAADLANVKTSSLDTSIKKMGLSISAAANGSKNLNAAFRELKLDPQVLLNLPKREQFITILTALSEIENGTRRNALGAQLLSRQWTETSNLLNTDLQASLKEFESYGLGISESQASVIDSFGDSKDKLSTLYDGFWQKMAVEAIPILTDITEGTLNWIREMGGVGPIAESLGKKMASVLEAVQGIASVISGIYNFVSDIVNLLDRAAATAKSLDDLVFLDKQQSTALSNINWKTGTVSNLGEQAGESFIQSSPFSGTFSGGGGGNMQQAQKMMQSKGQAVDVNVNVSVDKEGIIQVVTSHDKFGKAIDKRAEEAARGARN